MKIPERLLEMLMIFEGHETSGAVCYNSTESYWEEFVYMSQKRLWHFPQIWYKLEPCDFKH